MLRTIATRLVSLALLAAAGPSFAQAQTPGDLLQPDSWTDQHRSALREQHRCGTSITDAELNTGAAISRFAAAALLNDCLMHRSGSDPELVLLRHQLHSEMDGMDRRIAELEAMQFSPTTTLKGLASLVVGSNRFFGSDRPQVNDSRNKFGATTFNYDLKLYVDTSFTGQDLLRIRLRSGNFDRSSNSFIGAGPSKLSALETAFQEQSGADRVSINRIYYQLPIGNGFTAVVGPRVGQLELFALRPSVYPAESVLDLFTLKGAPGAYNFQLGAGGGIWWKSASGFSLSANYVAGRGNDGNPSRGGIGTEDSASTSSIQLAYKAQQWGAAAVVSSVQNSGNVIDYATNFTLKSLNNPGQTTALGLSGYWQPLQSGWAPSISAGWGINRTDYAAQVNRRGLVANSQSWSVGLQWSDAVVRGNVLGIAVGQPIFATSLYGGTTPRDSNFAWECWYKVQVSDNVALTPALFALSRPLGGTTPARASFGQIGALLKTTLRF